MVSILFGDHPNLRINISVDFLPRGMRTAPTIQEALAWQAGRENITIRGVALNPQQAIRMYNDPAFNVITLYHGPTGERLMEVIRRQNPDLIKSVGEEAIRREIDDWVPMSTTQTKIGKDLAKTYHDKVCCASGKCTTCRNKCGFGVGCLLPGVVVPEWFLGDLTAEERGQTKKK